MKTKIYVIIAFVAGMTAGLVVPYLSRTNSMARHGDVTRENRGVVQGFVEIYLDYDPRKVGPIKGKDAFVLLDELEGPSENQKRRIKDGISSGLIARLRIRGHTDGNGELMELSLRIGEKDEQGCYRIERCLVIESVAGKPDPSPTEPNPESCSHAKP